MTMASQLMPIPKTSRAPLSRDGLDRRSRGVAIRRTRGQCWRESPRRPLAWFRARTDQEILKWNGIGARYAAEIRTIRDTVSDDDVRAMMSWESDPEEIPFGWAEHAPTISLVGG